MTPAVADRAVPRHTHEDAHFVLVLDGQYVTSAAGAPATCPAPSLIFNPSGTTHRDRFQSKTGRFFTVSVGTEALRLASDHYRLPVVSAHFGAHDAVIVARRLAAECARPDRAAPLVLEGLSWELLAAVLPSEEGHHVPPAWLRSARDMLRDRAADRLVLADIATTVGVHPVHLTRAFRRFFRATPGAYLRRCRLERAAALLRETPLPLAEVALATGFADQSHLSAAFSRAYGAPPRRYRLRFCGRTSV